VGLIVSSSIGQAEFVLENPTFDPASRAMYWQPDGRHVVMADIRTGSSNLWALPVLGAGQEKQLTHFTTGIVWSFQYSPDGKWIAMARDPDQNDVVLFRSSN
jgi:Tol biopolymer transport system component